MNAANDIPHRGRLGEPHFVVAAAVLTVGAAMGCVMAIMVPITRKPVPWPEGVRVSGECRLLSLPARFGPYVLAEDGTLERERDGKPDGEIFLPEDILETLGVNTSLDRARLAGRRSNWYVSRFYRDTRAKRRRCLWRVQVVYYTGDELVVHEPGRCLVAAGATILGGKSTPVEFLAPGAPSPWDKPVEFSRTRFETAIGARAEIKQFVQYHVFSVNGAPVASVIAARLKLLISAFDRHCYFAMIEFAPYGPVEDPEAVNEAAAEFVKHFLPHVLAALPMPPDVEALNSPGGQPARN